MTRRIINTNGTSNDGSPPPHPHASLDLTSVARMTRVLVFTAGTPTLIVQGSRSLFATLPRQSTAPSPTVTPGPTVLRAAIHAPSSMRIGPVTRSNVDRDQSWLPVQR